jgi:hypothetical protein
LNFSKAHCIQHASLHGWNFYLHRESLVWPFLPVASFFTDLSLPEPLPSVGGWALSFKAHVEISCFMCLMLIANVCRYDLLCLEGLARALRVFTGTEASPVFQVSSIPRSSILQMHVKPEVSSCSLDSHCISNNILEEKARFLQFSISK